MNRDSIKTIDELGRIMLPLEMRQAFGWQPRKKLRITQTEHGVLIQAYQPECCLCGSEDEVRTVHERYLCKHCMKEIARLYDNSL